MRARLFSRTSSRSAPRVSDVSVLISDASPNFQDEVERFYTEDIPWYDDWLYPSSDDTEACAKAAKRRPFPVKAFPSGPTRTRGSRGDVSVKLEDMPAGVPSLADAEEADDEQPAASTSASRKGKGRASVGRSGSRAGNSELQMSKWPVRLIVN